MKKINNILIIIFVVCILYGAIFNNEIFWLLTIGMGITLLIISFICKWLLESADEDQKVDKVFEAKLLQNLDKVRINEERMDKECCWCNTEIRKIPDMGISEDFLNYAGVPTSLLDKEFYGNKFKICDICNDGLIYIQGDMSVSDLGLNENINIEEVISLMLKKAIKSKRKIRDNGFNDFVLAIQKTAKEIKQK